MACCAQRSHSRGDGSNQPASHAAAEGIGRTLCHTAAATHRQRSHDYKPSGGTSQEDGRGMEVKPGYKQTEVGIIPAEWNVKPFAELFEFRNGVNADKAAYGQGVRFINV